MGEIESLRIAALLHDIGKLWQGAGERGKHAELSTRFIRQYLSEELQKGLTFVAEHHDSSQYLGEARYPLKIIVLADWLASSERKDLDEEEERGLRRATPMESIFGNISLDKKSEKEKGFYSIGNLTENIFPSNAKDQQEKVEKDYKKLWNKFLDDVLKIRDLPFKDKMSYFVTLFHILKKYTSRVPSAVWQSIPDISLFDHSKMTCAFVDCIYKIGIDESEIGKILGILMKRKNNEELTEDEKELLDKPRFILIGGDISGVQRFIYSVTAEGATKGLKARSFYLQLLGEAIAKYILRKIDLTVANLTYCAGGHFYILAPKNIDLERIEEEIERVMAEIHGGELYVAIDKVDLSISDIIEKKIGEKWKDLGDRLGEKKKKKFSKILDENFFCPDIDPQNICHVCGSPSHYVLTDGEIKKCRFCMSLEEMSKKLASNKEVKIKYILECEPEGNEEEGTWEWNIAKFGIKYKILSDAREISGSGGILYSINNDEEFIPEKDRRFAYGFRFMFLTPLMNLDALYDESKGMKGWGVVRGDVDYLGRIFSEGLKEKDRTFSRMSTLSSLISLFFDYHMNRICEDFQGKVYGVYAGGDDFFIIGSWDILPDLAYRIYKDFRRYVANNPDVTLSCAISIAPSKKYPVYKIAEIAGDELDGKAKNIKRYYEERCFGGKIDRDKDALCFLGFPVKWNKFEELRDFKDELQDFINRSPRGILYKLYSIYEIYSKIRGKHGREFAKYDNRYGKWRWMLAYLIGRIKVKHKEEIKQYMVENIDYSPVVIKWVEYLTRGEKNE